ncbi:MAG: Diacylglycerol O-acyltransferase [Actinomycetota bacterium]|nr:Diacylglycerol O-acyltransferase [Actinomycetota bacterium]
MRGCRMTQERLDPIRLSGWDFATWRAASEDPIMRSTMIGLLILDGEPDWQRLVDRYERASRVVPILRQKVVEGPVRIANPRLVVDPDFDLSFHLRRFRMAEGSDFTDVLDECRRQSMTDFDRDRPLWKVTVLEGLPGGKSAVITKLHHAVADGQGALQLGAALVDLSPEGAELGPMPRAPRGESISSLSFAELMIRDNVDWVVKTAKGVAGLAVPAAMRFLQDPSEAIAQLSEVAGSLVRFARPPTVRLSPIMTARSINYHYGAFQLKFSDLRGASKATGHSLNDAYLAAVAEAMGEYHRRQGTPVAELNLNMPISLRKSDDHAQNAVTIAHFTVNTSEGDPVALMDEISRTVTAWRAEPALGFADQLAEISRFIPFEVISAAATASDVTASNVPGPPVPVFLAGAAVEQMIPLPPPIGAAVFVALLTYHGDATIGVAMDDAAVTDHALLMECMRHGFSKLSQVEVPHWDPLGPPAKKTPAKKAGVKKAPAKKAGVKKTPAKKAPAKKTSPKQAGVKKTTATKRTKSAPRKGE